MTEEIRKQVSSYLDAVNRSGLTRVGSSKVELCTWEALYPNMAHRLFVIEQVELQGVPIEVKERPPGLLGYLYEDKGYWVYQEEGVWRYWGDGPPTKEDRELYPMEYRPKWCIPVADPFKVLCTLLVVPPKPVEYIELKLKINSAGFTIGDSDDRA